MKPFMFVLFLPLLFRGCDGWIFAPVLPGTALPSLTLHDLSGRERAVFRPGEDFEMRFSLSNMTRESICYSYTPPEVVFTILSGDSVVSTSVDGWFFPQVFMDGCIRAGETYRARWMAPNPPGRDPRFVLAPGEYSAAVGHPALFDRRVARLRAVRFTIAR